MKIRRDRHKPTPVDPALVDKVERALVEFHEKNARGNRRVPVSARTLATIAVRALDTELRADSLSDPSGDEGQTVNGWIPSL